MFYLIASALRQIAFSDTATLFLLFELCYLASLIVGILGL